MATIDEINAMRQHCDVTYPDKAASPGAVWLGKLHDMIADAVESGRMRDEDPRDVVRELSDMAGSFSTSHDLWVAFVDLCAYAHCAVSEVADCSEGIDIITGPFGHRSSIQATVIRDTSDADSWAARVMSEIAYQGMWVWWENCQVNNPDMCDDCGEPEDDCVCIACEQCGESLGPGTDRRLCDDCASDD